jgi:hypothetical protein
MLEKNLGEIKKANDPKDHVFRDFPMAPDQTLN